MQTHTLVVVARCRLEFSVAMSLNFTDILATYTCFIVSMYPPVVKVTKQSHRILFFHLLTFSLLAAMHYCDLCVTSRYELQRGVSTTSSQLDETEQPSVGTTDLEDGDMSHKEVGCLANSSSM